MPFFSQIGASSSFLIGREASEMSVSPAQNFSKPPPVPDSPTVIFTSGCSSLNSSAAACVNGNTVDEPSILISPDSFAPLDEAPVSEVEPLSLPQAAAPNARAPDRAVTARMRMGFTCAP